ncbi:luciferase domain-containing protein [Halalkalicoccus jeotgali]|uniref:Luciferase domain-containing protein n=1 Tax=Halalkalicoccus jeotgali (strain DSM 18796 / CECT 7217 / JCM 14584 / KCTC 4019 / B3) TaxID=795797 RepID=D8J373_HALJB|nr:luciferase family protein [Halalkalicoccus jeotgali]ADJ15180.1 hypothetical protein HacjB3_08985 [Halalkalicoccus jeotgali B3]ELY35100.1 hypothetical protein C497_13695 [Halalkalicoccus jeotgali B3]
MVTTNSTSATDRGWIVETVSEWPGVETGPHRFGATEFTIDGREIGHIHGGRTLDINFPKQMKERLIADERTGEHRFAGGGWTTYRIESLEDVDHALRLCRLSYLYALLTRRRRPTGSTILAELDLDAELDRLDLDPDLRAMFERMRR